MGICLTVTEDLMERQDLVITLVSERMSEPQGDLIMAGSAMCTVPSMAHTLRSSLHIIDLTVPFIMLGDGKAPVGIAISRIIG